MYLSSTEIDFKFNKSVTLETAIKLFQTQLKINLKKSNIIKTKLFINHLPIGLNILRWIRIKLNLYSKSWIYKFA